MRGPKDTGKEKPPNAPTQHPTGAAQAPDHPANEEERLPAVDDEEQESGKFSQDSIVEETQQSSQASNTDVEESEKEGQEASEGGRTQPVVRGTEAGAIPLTQRDTSHSPQEEKCQERREADAHASVETSTGPSDVEPFEMFEAVVAEMQSAPMEQPRAAWIATIGELYSTVHAKVKVDEDLIPGSKRRYPKLKSEEKILLFKLFKAICVEANGTFEEWERYAQAATQDLYNTNWSFKNIMHSMISKVEWATTQPLNQWAEKVTGGAQTQSARANRTEATSSYQDFMFNPSKFSKEDIATLRAICAQPAAADGSPRLRPGSKDEWSIISGMTEGTIVCRRMPEFLRSVLDSRESIRLYSTIQSQVEGELMLQLRGRTGIKPNRQMTQWIQEDIRVAAEELQVNTPELKRMLNLAKTINYNEAQRSIHIFFFDRATARQYQTTMVPFRKTVYRLTNVHSPNSGSVWSRQVGRDGKRRSNQRHYAVDIYNVTRFTDIGRLTAYLQQHIGARFEMEDMDSCTPESRTSTVWRLTAYTSECPDFLRGIVRIVWYGRTLVLQHPSMRQRLQCLRCGNLGHTMARCRYTDQQLAGSGGRVAKEQDVAKLEDLARPFSSFEEIKQSVAKRLELQAEAERQEQAAVTPTENKQEKSLQR